MARHSNPENHPKSIPRIPQSTQNLTPKRPRSSQGRPWSTQGAPQKRPDRILTRPGGLWESFRAPQDLILELPKLIFHTLGSPSDPATHPSPVFPARSSLHSSLSFLGSRTGLEAWVLRPWDLGTRACDVQPKMQDDTNAKKRGSEEPMARRDVRSTLNKR